MSDNVQLCKLTMNLINKLQSNNQPGQCQPVEAVGRPGKPMGPIRAIGTHLRLPPHKRVFYGNIDRQNIREKVALRYKRGRLAKNRCLDEYNRKVNSLFVSSPGEPTGGV